MARNRKKSDIDINNECQEAYARLVTLAHQIASTLTGDPISPETGQTQTARSLALAVGMLYFLLRIEPDDMKAVFFGERSLAQFPFKSGTPEEMRDPPFQHMVY